MTPIHNETCAMCGGTVAPGTTTSTTDFGDSLVVVRAVPARVCRQCGEAWIDDAAAVELDRIVREARSRRVAVEIVSMATV